MCRVRGDINPERVKKISRHKDGEVCMANTRQRARLRYLYHLLVSKPEYEYQRMIGNGRYVGISLWLLVSEIAMEE